LERKIGIEMSRKIFGRCSTLTGQDLDEIEKTGMIYNSKIKIGINRKLIGEKSIKKTFKVLEKKKENEEIRKLREELCRYNKKMEIFKKKRRKSME
jgi:hypothetical protein